MTTTTHWRPGASTALVFGLFGCALLIRTLSAPPLHLPLGAAMLIGYAAMAALVGFIDADNDASGIEPTRSHPRIAYRIATGVLLGLALFALGGGLSMVSERIGLSSPYPDARVGPRSLLALGFVAAAFIEERAFRGVLQAGLVARLGPALGVWAQATVFASYHLEWGQLLPTFAYGLILGWVAQRDASLLRPTVAHLALNLLGLVLYLRTLS